MTEGLAVLYLYSTAPDTASCLHGREVCSLSWSEKLMKQPRLAIAQPDIVRVLDQHSLRLFRRLDLEKILADNRKYWRLAQNTTTSRFIDF